MHEEGLEPPRLAAPEPKSGASANSATRARAALLASQDAGGIARAGEKRLPKSSVQPAGGRLLKGICAGFAVVFSDRPSSPQKPGLWTLMTMGVASRQADFGVEGASHWVPHTPGSFSASSASTASQRSDGSRSQSAVPGAQSFKRPVRRRWVVAFPGFAFGRCTLSAETVTGMRAAHATSNSKIKPVRSIANEGAIFATPCSTLAKRAVAWVSRQFCDGVLTMRIMRGGGGVGSGGAWSEPELLPSLHHVQEADRSARSYLQCSVSTCNRQQARAIFSARWPCWDAHLPRSAPSRRLGRAGERPPLERGVLGASCRQKKNVKRASPRGRALRVSGRSRKTSPSDRRALRWRAAEGRARRRVQAQGLSPARARAANTFGQRDGRALRHRSANCA